MKNTHWEFALSNWAFWVKTIAAFAMTFCKATHEALCSFML